MVATITSVKEFFAVELFSIEAVSCLVWGVSTITGIDTLALLLSNAIFIMFSLHFLSQKSSNKYRISTNIPAAILRITQSLNFFEVPKRIQKLSTLIY